MPSRPGQLVCFDSFLRERSRHGPKILTYLAPTQRSEPTSPFRATELTPHEIEHRVRMLRHLTARRE